MDFYGPVIAPLLLQFVVKLFQLGEKITFLNCNGKIAFIAHLKRIVFLSQRMNVKVTDNTKKHPTWCVCHYCLLVHTNTN